MSWAASLRRLASGVLRIGRLRLVVLADLLQAPAAGVGVGGRALHEVEQVRLAAAGRCAAPSMTSRCCLLSAPLAAASLQLEILQRGDRRHARRGARQGQRRRSRCSVLRWNDGAPGSAFSALPSQPSVSVSSVLAGLPDVHRAEVRLARVGIADALHDAQGAVLEQLGQAVHRRVQAELVVDLLDWAVGLLAASAAAWRSSGR